MSLILNFFLRNKNILKYLFSLVIISGILLYHYLTVNSLEKQLNNISEELKLANIQIGKIRLVNEVCEANNKQLKANIDLTNSTIERMKIDKDKLEATIKEWENRPPEVVEKYITKYVPIKQKVTGEECIEVIKNITKLKYKDL